MGWRCRSDGLGMVGRGPVELSYDVSSLGACYFAGLVRMVEPLWAGLRGVVERGPKPGVVSEGWPKLMVQLS